MNSPSDELVQILSDLIEGEIFPRKANWNEIFSWDGGRKPESPYQPAKVLLVEKIAGRWVPEWFPKNHWTHSDEKGDAKPMSESERGFWFYAWLGYEVRSDLKWKVLTHKQKGIRVAEKMKTILQQVTESWPEDWYRPKLSGMRLRSF